MKHKIEHVSKMCDELRPLVLTICPYQMFEAGFHQAGSNEFKVFKSCDMYEAICGAYDMIKNPKKYEDDDDE